MSDSMNHRRKAVRVPILGICGFLLLVAGIVGIAVTDAWACTNCNCYYSSDCATGQSCNYSSGCRVWKAAGKTVDGTCTGATTQTGISDLDSAIAAQALDLWLQAYEHAGLQGGTPDESLIAEARSLPLNPGQHEAIRRAVITTEVALFGVVGDDDEPGRFLMPKDTVVICDPVPADPVPITPVTAESASNGALQRLDPDALGVARMVRETMVAQLRNPQQSEFSGMPGRIQQEFPKFSTTGVCQYPRSDNGPFPFKNSADCLSKETLRIVQSLLDNNLGRPSHPTPASQ